MPVLVHQEWLISGETLITDLLTEPEPESPFPFCSPPYRDSQFSTSVLPPLSPAVVLSPSSLVRQIP